MIKRSHHDMGGLPAGKVERSEHDYSDWERRVDAMSVLLGAKKLLTVDHRRRNIEALPPEAYDAMSYYERWVASLGMSLIQRGIITTAELARKMLEVERRGFHDMGGLPAGKVERSEHDEARSYSDWEQRVDALMMILSGIKGAKRLITVDELRKNIEALPPKAYDAMGYYERWITSVTQTLIQRGIITTEELAKKMAEVDERS
jgi:nitrile hydratase subunit beta